jgi:hypothetical protein
MKKYLTIPVIGLLLLFASGFSLVVSDLQAQAGGKSPPVLAQAILEKIDAAIPSAATANAKPARRILVFWRCEGFFHGEGIAGGNHAFAAMGRKTGAYITDFSDDYNVFEPANLANYDAVVFNNTTQLKLPDTGRQALIEFVRKGKGLVGVHAATDSFYDWPEGAVGRRRNVGVQVG